MEQAYPSYSLLVRALSMQIAHMEGDPYFRMRERPKLLDKSLVVDVLQIDNIL
jgi:hypothetical protein